MIAISFTVLRLLADGEFHSGVDIARELGVSRGTVWNAVRALDAAGIDVYRVRGRGYRIAHAVSLLDPQSIARHLRHNLDFVQASQKDRECVFVRCQNGPLNS